MEINAVNNINFQKKLVAKGSLKKKGGREQIAIYKLEQYDDKRYIPNLKRTFIWENNHYLDSIDRHMKYGTWKNENYYVMEDEKGKCICISETDSNNKETKLQYLETAPEYAQGKKSRPYKYIGETMLAYLVGIAEKSRKNFNIPNVADRPATEKFYYEQCGFNKKGNYGAELPKNLYRKFIESNEKHTGSAIETIG